MLETRDKGGVCLCVEFLWGFASIKIYGRRKLCVDFDSIAGKFVAIIVGQETSWVLFQRPYFIFIDASYWKARRLLASKSFEYYFIDLVLHDENKGYFVKT